MILSTPGFVLHTTPYSESSVVVKVFTRQLGLRSYIIKGVRGNRGKVKQNMLQPLSCLDMVVYDSSKTDLNYIKELSLRHSTFVPDPVANALSFFMTEVLYKALREAEPMPNLWDYVEQCALCTDLGYSPLLTSHFSPSTPHLPIHFLLTVARYLGIEPMDNHCAREPYFDLQEGRFVGVATESTLPITLSASLHGYLASPDATTSPQLDERIALIDALLAYFHLHLGGFNHFRSHEILHTVLK